MWYSYGSLDSLCCLAPLTSSDNSMNAFYLQEPPDPGGSRICCPHTPPPPMMGNAKSTWDARWTCGGCADRVTS